MERTLSISKQSPAFPDYLDFQSLRTIGIEHLQQLSGKIWTDYNLHDPGITILEVLSYAITDLGYRNNLDIKDLLTPESYALSAQDSNFFTPDEILTCNPVTELDIRKRLIDIPGVRNAWLEKINDPSDSDGETDIEKHFGHQQISEATAPQDEDNQDAAPRRNDSDVPIVYINRDLSKLQFEPPYPDAPKLYFKGLYRVLLDLDSVLRTDACGKNYQPRAAILSEVRAVLNSHRNLCEDFHEIVILEEEKIALTKTRIELEATANVEDVLVEIYTQVQNFLAPQLRFYTLQELLDNGKSTAEIFAGRPSALPDHDAHTAYGDQRKSHGFIDTDELEALTLPQVIYASDLYQLILNIPGVVAIQSLNLSSYINDLLRIKNEDWELPLTKSYRPVLDLKNSKIEFFTQGFAIEFNFQVVKRRYDQQQITQLKAQRDAYELDLPIPRGTHYDIADHYSIHHDFPLTYGISEDGLPDTVSFQRKAQAKQLKGYLVFFDQLLANYLNQLAQVRTLFSWDENQWAKHQSQQHTYVAPQRLLNFAGVQDIIQAPLAKIGGNDLTYPQFLQTIMEDGPTANERRHRMLDHLLARFSEEFTDYIILNYQPEYELRILVLSDATQLPDKGDGLVVIAKINDVYHVRIFDRAGELVIDKGRNQFFPNENLVQQFDQLISRISSGNGQSSQAILNNAQKYNLIQKIAANLGYTFTEENQRLHDKANFLKDYPTVSRDRFRAINYYRPYDTSESPGISGFQRRLSRMLGIRSLNSQGGANGQPSQDEERFYVLEHILLRPHSQFLNKADLAKTEQLLLPITTGKTQSFKTEFQAAVDPYSFWISVLFPAWPRRFEDRTFRQLIERTVRLEAPAHVTVKTGWLDQPQMEKFEIAHRRWLAELNLQATTGQACNLPTALENLINVMSNLRSVYPQAVLADAQGNTADDAVAIILT